MSYLQDDLNKLIKYAQGLGLRVVIRDYDGSGDGAGWTTDGTEITLFRWKNQTITRMILNLLHELGHHLAWVYADRITNPKVDNALAAEDSRKKGDPFIPKRKRKIIYEEERFDAQYREVIAKEVGLRVPLWKIKADIDIDIWGYRVYYETGKHPTAKDMNTLYKELKARYKNER